MEIKNVPLHLRRAKWYTYGTSTKQRRLLTEACDFVRRASEERKNFLFRGNKEQTAGIIAQKQKDAVPITLIKDELGGILTNWFTIRTSRKIKRLRKQGGGKRVILDNYLKRNSYS